MLGVIAAAAVLLIALAWAFQRRLIYLPAGAPRAPAALGIAAEEVLLRTRDGLELDAWFVPAERPIEGTAVLVLPGNAGHRGLRAPLADALSSAGFATLLVDYRGYGGNPGRPSEKGLRADARAARAWLAARPGVERIAYYGESLGAAVAVDLALEHPPAALVLRSPFTSLSDIGRRHYPFLPVDLLLRDRFRVVGRIGELAIPVLVVAGSEDGIIPPANSRRVADAVTAPSRFVLIEGAGHNSPALLDGERLLDATISWLNSHASGSGSSSTR